MNEKDEIKTQEWLAKTGGNAMPVQVSAAIPTPAAPTPAPTPLPAVPGFHGLGTTRLAAALQEQVDDIWHKIGAVSVGITPTTGTRIENTYGQIVDKELSVDKIVTPGWGNRMLVQEKIRSGEVWDDPICRRDPRCPDITFEVANGNGKPSEWDHFFSDWYFYAWAIPTVTIKSVEAGVPVPPNAIRAWVILNSADLKWRIRNGQGIYRWGPVVPNNKHGSASFIPIALRRLTSSIVMASDSLRSELAGTGFQDFVQ